MQSVGPVGNSLGSMVPATFVPARQASASQAAGGSGASGVLSAGGVSAQSTLSQITQVNSQVDAFLGSVGINLQNNQMVRMIIALLILELLMGQDGQGGKQQSGSASALSQLSTAGDSSRLFMFHSTTSVYRSEYHASELSGGLAVQSSASTAGDGAASGRLDMSA